MKPYLLFMLLCVGSLSVAAQTNHWPSFRGEFAAGVADKQNLPETWDGAKGAGVKWKVRIPGLAHSSPVIWGDQVFVTTAISSKGEAKFKPGLYGDGDASDDKSVHQWKVFCLDKKTGKIRWEQIAFEGVQRSARHKAGLRVVFPRIKRWRRDKKSGEADTLEMLRALLPEGP